MYSDEDIEEVRSRNDIVDVISSYVQLKKKGSNYFGLCPFHSEKSPSFSVSPAKQMYYCFGCHKGGNIYTFLMEYDQCSFPEAVEAMAEKCGYALPKQEMTRAQKERQNTRTKLSYIYKDAANYYYSVLHSTSGTRGRQYFQGERGLDRDTMRSFALGFADGSWDGLYKYLKAKGHADDMIKESGLAVFNEEKGVRDYFRNRVIFPIVNDRGDPIALGGRVLDDSKPKYLNSRENAIFEKRNTIYGYNIARRTRRDFYILCEGYMDVIALHSAGFDNAIAALGTALTNNHVAMLKKTGKKVYICFDSDFAGVDATLRAIGMMRHYGVDCKVITMGEFKDPDEFIKAKGAEAFEERIKEAENSFIFAIDMRRRDFDVNDPDENNKFFRNMAGRIALIETDIERENYIVVLSERYNVPADSLRELIRNVAASDKEMRDIREEFYSGVNGADVRGPDDAAGDESEARPTRQMSIKAKSDAGLKETEGILLTWLFEDPTLYSSIATYISPDDFQEGLYREIATDMFNAYSGANNDTSGFDPAALMCKFEDNEAHKTIASMLHTKIDGIESDEEREVLLKETLIKLKQEGLKNIDKSKPGSGKRIMQIKNDIRQLQSSNLL